MVVWNRTITSPKAACTYEHIFMYCAYVSIYTHVPLHIHGREKIVCINEVTLSGVPVFKSSFSPHQHQSSNYIRSESSGKETHPVTLYAPYFEDLRYS